MRAFVLLSLAIVALVACLAANGGMRSAEYGREARSWIAVSTAVVQLKVESDGIAWSVEEPDEGNESLEENELEDDDAIAGRYIPVLEPAEAIPFGVDVSTGRPRPADKRVEIPPPRHQRTV